MNTSIIRGFVTAIAFTMLVAGAGATTKGPGAGGYVGTDEIVASFIDLSVGGSTSILSGVDDGMTPLTLPFPVPFFGVDYTMACVSANGAAYLVSSSAECSGFIDFANTDLNATPPAALAALLPLWSDLTFEMPGAGITGFTRKAAKMAEAGIYDLRIHHDDIIWPLLRYWKVFERTGLDPEAEQARERLTRFLEKLDSSARRYEEKRAARREASAASAD